MLKNCLNNSNVIFVVRPLCPYLHVWNGYLYRNYGLYRELNDRFLSIFDGLSPSIYNVMHETFQQYQNATKIKSVKSDF